MAQILSVNAVSKAFGVDEILKDVTFTVKDGEKTAIVGCNGAGKTTLLNIVSGQLAPDNGSVSLSKGVSLGFLTQMAELTAGNNVYDELLTVFKPLLEAEEEARQIEREMGAMEGAVLTAALERYDAANHEFERLGGYAYESKARGVMAGLGFTDEELKLSVDKLSGGQKTRVSLGKLLLTAPDLLLLDEPTNHLDAASVEWLEDTFLREFKGAALIVSHDRYFLDKVADKVVGLENGKSFVNNGNYTSFAYKRELEREIALKSYADQQKIIAKQEETIRLLKSFNREKSIKRAESREKMLAKMERLEKPENAPERIHMSFTPRYESGNDVLSLRNVSKTFHDKGGDVELFKGVNFDLHKGDCAAIVGVNGVGKTTLFHMIEKGAAGIRLGVNVSIGAFDQEFSSLNADNTAFDELLTAHPKLTNLEIRSTLAAFGFKGGDVFKTIDKLSGGEKGRVLLARLMLGSANFIMLDEPTNHLDMDSKEILEEALRGYEGTVLYISHDRYFINATADFIIELTQGGAAITQGSYDDYLAAKKSKAAVRPAEEKAEQPQQKKRPPNEKRRLEAELKKLERDIAGAEQQLVDIDNEVIKPEVYVDKRLTEDLYAQKDGVENRLAALYARWEQVSMEVESAAC